METFLPFCFGQQSWTKGARHACFSIQIGGRILPLKIFIANPRSLPPPLSFFVSGSRMRDPFFFSFILFHTTSRADRIFQHDLHDKSFRFEQNLPYTWVSKKWNSETFVYVTPLNFKQFHWSELDFQDK